MKIYGNGLDIDLFGPAISHNYSSSYGYPKSFDEASILIEKILEKINWKNSAIKNAIRTKLRSSLIITFSDYFSESVKFGATKWGGTADLPTNNSIQIEIDDNLNLLCQINLEQINTFDLHPLLPKKGILYFFFQEDTSFAYQSILKVHYAPDASIIQYKVTNGYFGRFRPVFTFPNNMTKNYNELEEQFKEDGENLQLFTKELHQAMGYFWYSTLLLAEPIPMQGPPFETSPNHPERVVPILDFAYREPKYHVGIFPTDLENLEFDKIVFTGAGS